MTLEDDARSLEAVVARFISALLLRFIHASRSVLQGRAPVRRPGNIEPVGEMPDADPSVGRHWQSVTGY
jgi:hypothetical protein